MKYTQNIKISLAERKKKAKAMNKLLMKAFDFEWHSTIRNISVEIKTDNDNSVFGEIIVFYYDAKEKNGYTLTFFLLYDDDCDRMNSNSTTLKEAFDFLKNGKTYSALTQNG